MTQSLKQKWVSERLFSTRGSIAGMIVRLEQIAKAPSTLCLEAYTIYQTIKLLKTIEVDVSINKEASWNRFKLLKG
jgi:hypothetical protein